MELIDLLFHHVRESIDLKGPLVIQYSNVLWIHRGRAIRLSTSATDRSKALLIVPFKGGKIRFAMFNPQGESALFSEPAPSEEWIGPTLHVTDPNCLEEITIFVYEFFGIHNFFGAR